MERRGFIEKFAKAAVGTVLAPEALFGEETLKPALKQRLPTIVKVQDETALVNGEVRSGTLREMFRAGLRVIYSDIPEEDFMQTLFPGLMEDGKLGIKINIFQNKCEHINLILNCLVEALKKFPYKKGLLDRDKILIWDGQEDPAIKLKWDSNNTQLFLTQAGTEDEFEAEWDNPLEFDDFSLIPYPILSRKCQFQLGLVSAAGELAGKHPCRDAYLSCFWCREFPELPEGMEEETLNSVYERIHYPLGMKFRLFVLDRIVDEEGIYFGYDSILLDQLVSGEMGDEWSDKINLVEIKNPSAPVVQEVNTIRRGNDIEIRWADDGYEGHYQIYRSEKAEFVPERNLLIGVTNRKTFIDSQGAAGRGYYYRVTREWG